MRNIPTKQDDVGDTLDAASFNSQQNELENLVTSADITLDPAGGPDSNLNMTGQAVAAYANAGSTYSDSGTANAYILQLGTNLDNPVKYYDNMTVLFKAGNTNTGAATVNIESLGVKPLTKEDGTELEQNDIVQDDYHILIYNLSEDRFELFLSKQPRVTISSWNTVNGYGSTATMIQKFTTEVIASNDIVVTIDNNAASGFSVTANMDCFLHINYYPNFSSGGPAGLSKNSTQLTTSINSITPATRMAYSNVNGANEGSCNSWSGTLVSGDTIRPHTGGSSDSTSPDRGSLSILAIEIL